MRIARKRFLPVVATAMFAAICHAQSPYPSRPVRLLIPFAPGGSTDFVARVMQPRMIEDLGQPLVVENRSGASGNIAVEIAAAAHSDGHTVLFGNVGTIAINPALFRDFRINTVRDFHCVSVVADVSFLMIANPAVPVATVDEFVRYAKARPGQLNFASSGAGSNGRLAMEYLMSKTGIEMGHIAYKGASGSVAAVISGETHAGFGATPAVIPHLKTGRLKALALVAPRRAPSVPHIPTMEELGFPELNVSSWQGLYMPAKTPPPFVAKFRRAVTHAMTDPKVVETLKIGGAEPMDRALLDECGKFTQRQADFWAGLVKKAGLAGSQ